VDPDTLILVGPKTSLRIGDLKAGDRVWTCPEHNAFEYGYYAVEWVRYAENERLRLTLADGRALVCSVNHRMLVGGEWRRADSLRPGETIIGKPGSMLAIVKRLGLGPVVQTSIPIARTYLSADGLWCHNTYKQ